DAQREPVGDGNRVIYLFAFVFALPWPGLHVNHRDHHSNRWTGPRARTGRRQLLHRGRGEPDRTARLLVQAIALQVEGPEHVFLFVLPDTVLDSQPPTPPSALDPPR